MGDRTWWYEKCPKCGEEIEVYDAPSCLQFSRECQCGWTDGLDYYEARDNVIELLTEKGARKKKLIFDCPKCKQKMIWWEKEKYKMCIVCSQNNS